MYEKIDQGILKETAQLAIAVGEQRREKLKRMKEAFKEGNEDRAIKIARELCGLESCHENTDTCC
jgi:hypothetical protein